MAADPPRTAWTSVLNVRRGEWTLAASMFGYFFLVITTFWILKPIKKAVFLRHHQASPLELLGARLDGAQAELVAKVANMFVAVLAAVVFASAARHLRRERLTFLFCVFFAVTLVGYGLSLGTPSGSVVWSFYLYGDLYGTLMVATFFAFLNDSVTPSTAKRVYGLIVLGGVLGGAFGSSVLNAWIRRSEVTTWMWVCLFTTVSVAALAWAAGRAARSSAPSAIGGAAGATSARPQRAQLPAIAGARLVARSRYLLSIAAIVGLYEVVSTILDFQFTRAVTEHLSGDAIGAHLAVVYNITNVASLLVQLFVSTFVMSRYPLKVALLVTPLAILSASTAFLLLPALWVGSLLNTADNAFAYSINQSAREALYTPTSRDEKYEAKAFIDIFVQRLAKALAVGVSLALTLVFDDFQTVRWLSLVVLAAVALWIGAARYGGARFARLSTERPRLSTERPR